MNMLRTTGKFQPTFTATLFQQLFHVLIRLRSRFKPLAGVCICSKISKLMYFASIFAIFSTIRLFKGIRLIKPLAMPATATI